MPDAPADPDATDPLRPHARYLVVCLNGRATARGEQVVAVGDGGQTELADAAGGHLVLVDPVRTLAPGPRKPPFPCFVPTLYLYAQLGGGTGPHELSVELVRWGKGEHAGRFYPVFESPRTPLDCGRDRAAAHVYHARFAPCILPTAGQYSFRLLCDGEEIARAELELLEAS
jgi:hypothetical protein